MAIRPLPGAQPAGRAGVVARLVARPELVLAGALPFLFLKSTYQDVAGVELSDFAVLAVGATALAVGVREGFAPLRRGTPVWIAGGALLVWIALRALTVGGGYETGTHTASAAKFAEYALLALAVPLLVRGRRELELVLGVLAAWTFVADAVALVQYFGLDVFERWRPGGRQPSFLGPNDYSVLSTAALVAGICALAFGLRLQRRLMIALLVAGGLGTVLGASSAGVLGCWLALAGALLLTRAGSRAVLAAAALLLIVTVGVVNVRDRDYDQFLRFLGVKVENESSSRDVQTYTQRTILAYIGWRTFEDHPLVGAGWHASFEPRVYMRYVPDAKRKWPDKNPISFPSPTRVYGVQNGWLQAAADLGVVGFALFAALLGSAIVVAWRRRAVLGFTLTLLVCALWLAEGLYAGVPLDALMWLAIGLAVGGDG